MKPEAFYVAKMMNLARRQRHSLPYVYMSVLWHFVRMISDSQVDWHPARIRRLLYWRQEARQWPLWVYDPKETVSSLIDIQGKLWDIRKDSGWTFRQFRLAGPHILHGRAAPSERWKTLVAYCGECHAEPLIWGENESCQSCGRLICHECGHCARTCSEYARRQTKKMASNTS